MVLQTKAEHFETETSHELNILYWNTISNYESLTISLPRPIIK